MILRAESLEKRFGKTIVLKDFSLQIDKKEIVCIIGPSGCGKSTLLNIISGLLRPDAGHLDNNSKCISYVFQEDRLLPWKTAFENIHMVNRSVSDEKIEMLIDKVGLKGFGNHYPAELSGGMRQRCSIARAFNYKADLMLMDEPFKSLDYNLRFSMIDHLLNLWEMVENSILFVTHEIDEALLLGDKVVILSNRPTKVMKIIHIEIPKRERLLSHEKLVILRSQIVENLIS